MELLVCCASKQVRAVIRFLIVRREKPIEILHVIRETYGDACPDISQVRKWVRKFRVGRISIDDVTQVDRLRDSTTQENDVVIQQLIETNPGVAVR